MMYGILAANLWPRGRAQENYRYATTKVINQPAATYLPLDFLIWEENKHLLV